MNHRSNTFSWLRFASGLLVAVSVFLAQGDAQKSERRSDELGVLFIGNSLTYSNDLPSMIEALARASGDGKFAHETIAYPNFSLEDHWNDGRALKAIRKGKWDLVVMQQGPSAGKEGRDVLLKYGKLFGDEITKAGGRPAMYMVWPAAIRANDFGGVRESYKLGADVVNGLFLPVGEAWLNTMTKYREPVLYSSDGFHPTVAGTYLAALVIYEHFFGRSAVGLPSKLRLRSGIRIDLSDKDAAVLQQTASDVNAKFKSKVK